MNTALQVFDIAGLSKRPLSRSMLWQIDLKSKNGRKQTISFCSETAGKEFELLISGRAKAVCGTNGSRKVRIERKQSSGIYMIEVCPVYGTCLYYGMKENEFKRAIKELRRKNQWKK